MCTRWRLSPPCIRMYRGLNRGEIASIILGDGPKSRMVGTSSASIAMHDFHLHFLYGLYFRVIARSARLLISLEIDIYEHRWMEMKAMVRIIALQLNTLGGKIAFQRSGKSFMAFLEISLNEMINLLMTNSNDSESLGYFVL